MLAPGVLVFSPTQLVPGWLNTIIWCEVVDEPFRDEPERFLCVRRRRAGLRLHHQRIEGIRLANAPTAWSGCGHIVGLGKLERAGSEAHLLDSSSPEESRVAM